MLYWRHESTRVGNAKTHRAGSFVPGDRVRCVLALPTRVLSCRQYNITFDCIMLRTVPRRGKRRVRNPSRRFASARLPVIPCARRSHTLRAGSCETWPDHRWRAQWVFRDAGVWGEDDLQFLGPRAGVAERRRPFSYCTPGIFRAGAFALRANPLTLD